MATPNVRVGDGRLRRVNVPVPNPGFAEWLMGPESRAHVERVTQAIFQAYRDSLPASRFDPKVPGSGQRNLIRHAYWKVEVGGWGNEHDRWVGRVGNNAVSYRPRRGYHYGRFIEYGKPSKGIPGQHQLQRAVDLVTGGLSGAAGFATPSAPDIRFDPRVRRFRDRRGRFTKRPT